MVKRVDAQPIFAKLANTVVVILTTICSGFNGAPLERVVDESSQWNAFGSHVEEKSIVDSEALTARRAGALTHRQRGEAADDAWDLASSSAQDEYVRYDHTFDAAPHTAFGAGSIALSSLGHNASISPLRSS